jgi:hypothetical protein
MSFITTTIFCLSAIFSGDLGYLLDLKGPEMTFEETLIELGLVEKGEKKVFYYHYTNTGDEPLQIEFVSSCDCTEVEYSTDPLPPGEKDKMKVTFDSGKKDESETIGIDIMLTHTDPVTDAPVIITVEYSYEM